MSLFTKFLKLIKPQNHEYYNVEHFNHNSELIDKKMEEHDTALTTIQQGATNSQKGIVQFGIEEGKALEGNMLARLAGAYGFGGDIQNPGVKNQNYIYYDNNTRKMYKCLNQNSDTSANVQNYVPIDNFSFLERLENLYKTAFYHPDRWKPRHEDELTKTGAYQIRYQNTTLKQGFVGSQCFVLVFNTSAEIDDWITQVAFSYYNQHSMAIRTRNGSGVWTPWRYFTAN